MRVEWRHRGGNDAILLVNAEAEVEATVPAPDAGALKDYLAVTGDLERWQETLTWRPIDAEQRDPASWGALVISRDDSGQVMFVDPELFWDGVYRWFRSRGVDYNT
jgi:hypothetical protein